MPEKGVITISELVLLTLVWNSCQSVWRGVVIDGLNQAVRGLVPKLDRFYQNVVVGSVLLATLFTLVLVAANVNIGVYKVFELTN